METDSVAVEEDITLENGQGVTRTGWDVFDVICTDRNDENEINYIDDNEEVDDDSDGSAVAVMSEAHSADMTAGYIARFYVLVHAPAAGGENFVQVTVLGFNCAVPL